MTHRAPLSLSVLDLASVREGGSIADSFRHTLDLARHVERWGYKRFWLAEHHNMTGIASAATSVLIGYVANGTTTLRVGSGGIMLPNHASLVIAEQFGTLETLYPGRIDLGLGRAPGSDGYAARALGRDASSGDKFPDQVRELLGLLGPVVPGQRLQAVPGSGTQVPVWLLGSSTFSAHLAAMLGLPFAFAGQFAPVLLGEALDLYRTRFQPSSYLDRPYIMVGLPVIAADTDAQAQYLATSSFQRVLRLRRGQPIFVPPPVESMDGLWNELEQQMVREHFGVAVIGGPETVRQKLRSFAESTQADELMLHSEFYRHEDRLRSYEIVASLGL
ncbi:MAG TPA: LLM class flavin-dependent oxidoreductase [Candidatus Limnocylindria bacterium]|nr:LLM class flavin-dependent oxidoreductase [Candidatus Limnocylindria bacterium]